MKNKLFGAATVALLAVSVSAQTTQPEAAAQPATEVQTAPVEAVVPPAPVTLVLPADTDIKVAVSQDVTSSTHKAGDIIALAVAEDVKVDGVVVIPKGAPATAEITWRTGKGGFGKSGKLEFSMRSIALDAGVMPVKGDFRQEGEGNTVATGVGIVAVGIFAGFITGKTAVVPAGRELIATPLVDTPFTTAGGFANGFDGQMVLDEALAATPLGQCKAAASKIEKEKKREKAIEKCYVKRADDEPEATQSF